MARSVYTRPALRAKIVRAVKASSKGGRPGQWSARKAQIAARLYEQAGGGYDGPKTKAQRDLVRWSDEDWTTIDDRPARRETRKGKKTTARYLPREAWRRLSPAQRKATDRKKRAGTTQHVPNTKAAKRAAAKIRNRKRRPWQETYKSGKAAAKIYYDNNSAFFDNVRDPVDLIRDFFSAERVRGRPFLDTKRGRELIADSKGAGYGAGMIERSLAYIFGKNRSRRWDRVDWAEIEDFEQQIAEAWEPYDMSGQAEPVEPGATWRPLAVTTPDRVGLLSESEQAIWFKEQERIALFNDLEDLKEALELNQRCLKPAHVAKLKRQIKTWEKWADDPETAPEWACEPDMTTGGFTCDYPRISGEARRIADACERGYDLEWWIDDAGTPGFPPPPEDTGPEFLPIEAFEGSEELEPDKCTIEEAGRTLGRASARARKASAKPKKKPRKKKPKAKRNARPSIHSAAFWD